METGLGSCGGLQGLGFPFGSWPCSAVPLTQDCSMVGSILRSPDYGNCPIARCKWGVQGEVGSIGLRVKGAS